MASKLVKDMDEELWRKFVAYCKIKNVKVGNELAKLIASHIKKNLKGVLK